VAWAIGGAFRQTTTSFLFPLWIFMLWRGRQWRWVPLHIAVAAPIIFGWTYANNYFMEARSGFQRSASREFWDLQVMMPIEYDTASLAVAYSKTAAHPDYHWPMIEVAAWLAAKSGQPFYSAEGAPEPSLRHAMQLAGIQLGKVAFYSICSVPALGLLLVLLAVRRRSLTLPAGSDALFYAAWIVPPLGFFVVGHFGSFGYLQVSLSGLTVLVTGCLFSRTAQSDEPAAREIEGFAVHGAALGLAAVGLLFYLVGCPTHGKSPAAKTLDVLLLQYTGPAIRQKYAVARSTVNRADPRQLPFVPPDCETDEQLLTIAEQIDWWPEAYYRLRPSR
jgi:hypothetical protein